MHDDSTHPPAGEPHDIITPRRGTVRRVLDGSPADVLDQTAYPLTATCLECGGTIRCERFWHAPWRHVSTAPPASNVATLLPPLRDPDWDLIDRVAAEMGLWFEAPRLQVVRP